MSAIDKLYRKAPLFKMFTQGWGNPELLKRIIDNHKIVSKRETCKHLIKSFDVITTKKKESKTTITIEGSFLSPFYNLLPDTMDENNRVARFQLIIPKMTNNKYNPLCIHYSGTGDHNYSRRKLFLANSLLKNGVASLIHTNPFYGSRKPPDQKGSSLNFLSDLFVMGGALILETQVLLNWAKNEGFGPLSVHGISMGGHMACLGVAVYPEPVCLIPCLSWTTASHVFTRGVMSKCICWKLLSDQYHSDERFSKDIRTAIYPSIPFHFNNISESPKQITVNSKYSISDEKLLKPSFDTFDRKFHYLISNQGNIRSRERYFSSDSSINENKISKLTNLKKYLYFTKETNTEHQDDYLNEDKDPIKFMREILDFFTHFSNYSVPMDTRLVTIIAAEKDAYVPITGVAHFHDVWDSCCDIRIISGAGHIGTYINNSLFIGNQFKNAIIDTLNRYVELYHNEPGSFHQRIKFT